ncbi:hypothetical protein GWK47_006517 [Chionoecetes opilio]|uniref:Transposase n=1 Tax=Chionoecetes opilio TaxID=41210 RepID=A0A8J4YGX9_CHIOP|nr:hypothetical protein GWK47_006517 [Chionoecetes opilio]
MGKNKDFSAETIAQIIALNKSSKQTKAISEQIGVCPRIVGRWVAKFDQEGGHTTPTHKKRPGKPKKTDSRSQTIVKRELESNPRMTARKLKESNPDIFDQTLRDRDQDQTFRDQDQPSETKTKTLRDQDQDQTLRNRPTSRTGI